METANSPEYQRSSQNLNDTQVLPSQVYAQYYSSRTVQLQDGVDTTAGAAGGDESGPRTYVTGDTGHVDLMRGYEDGDENAQDGGSDSDTDEDDFVGQSPSRAEAVTSPTRFSPTTPALVGQKHDRHGSIISSIRRTPAPDLTAMFAEHEKNDALGLSQVFHQTQAPSSPLPEILGSDCVFERPSPTFVDLGRRSPASSLSSPPFAPRDELQRTYSDPQNVYIPTRDSQKRRELKALQEEGRALKSSLPRDGFDVDFPDDIAEKHAQSRQKKAQKQKEAFEKMRSLAAPADRAKRRSSRASISHSVIGLTAPGLKGKPKSVDLVSDNPTPANGHTRADVASDEEAFDENDEFNQALPSSARALPKRDWLDFGHPDESSNERDPMTAKRRSSAVHQGIGATPSDQLTELERRRPVDGQQSSNSPKDAGPEIVADSQPERTETEQDLPKQHPVEVSLETSQAFVAQSQPLSLSGNARVQLAASPEKSSSIAFPPKPSNRRVRNETNYDDAKGAKVMQSHAIDSVHFASSPEKTGRAVQTNEPQGHDMVPDELVSLSPTRKSSRMRKKPRIEVPETSPASMLATAAEPENANASHAEPRPSSPLLSAVHDLTFNNNSHNTSKSTPVFETAPSRQSSSPRDRRAPLAGGSGSGSQTASQQKLSAILTNSSPPGAQPGLHDDVNVLNVDDVEFAAAISGSSPIAPKRKRQRMRTERVAFHASTKATNSLPPTSPASLQDPKSHSAGFKGVHASLDDATVSTTVAHKASLAGDEDTARPTSPIRKAAAKLTKAASQSESGARRARQPGTNVFKSINAQEGKDKKNGEANAAVGSAGPTAEFREVDNTSLSSAIEPDLFPQRVLARFTGNSLAFYAATYLGVSEVASPPSYVVLFDDGTMDSAPTTLVRRFELRVGDTVKVDLEEWRKYTYIVHGFKDRRLPTGRDATAQPKTDIYGNETVVLRRKQRVSLPRDGGNADSEPRLLEVPMTNIYLSSTMWVSFADRVYTYGEGDTESSSRLRTPLATHQASDLAKVDKKSTLFSNMAFAITYTNAKEEERKRIVQLISANGGRVLPQGFEELFGNPTDSENDASPENPANSDAVDAHPLQLTAASENLTLTAVIADGYSRRKKYLQALALNLPCLAGRWIPDCVLANQVLPWGRYLLPAGESSFLGAVRSRTLVHAERAQNAATAKLSVTINNRPNLLRDKRVILVKGNVRDEEKMQAHLFLTRALGAGKVAREKNIAGVKKLLDDGAQRWDWIYVADGGVDEAKTELLGSAVQRGKKRHKRRESEAMKTRQTDSEEQSALNIVGDEYIVQSLILGELLPPE